MHLITISVRHPHEPKYYVPTYTHTPKLFDDHLTILFHIIVTPDCVAYHDSCEGWELI